MESRTRPPEAAKAAFVSGCLLVSIFIYTPAIVFMLYLAYLLVMPFLAK